MELGPSVWAITGIKCETFDSEDWEKVLPDAITGRLNETTTTIIHGETWVDAVESIESLGYAYLKVSLQKMEEFEAIPFAERGLGAVSGGFISSSSPDSSEPFKTEQEWGVIYTSKAHYVGGFYSHERYNRVMVCFDRTNVAPVSGFWENETVLIGPNIQCDKQSWGKNFERGSFAVVLEEVTSTVVLAVNFPKLLTDSVETIKPQVIFSRMFTNGSSATATGKFNLKTTLLDTHTFVFEDGLEVDWSVGWKAKVPLLSQQNQTVGVEVSFAEHRPCATSKTQDVDSFAEIHLTPMTAVKATARYSKHVITVGAVLTVQKTYTNGASHTSEIPAKYTGVSCDLAEIVLEGIPVASTSVR